MKSKKNNFTLKVGHNGLPNILIQLGDIGEFGFTFIVDTSVRGNYIDPCFYEEWIKDQPTPLNPVTYDANDPFNPNAIIPNPVKYKLIGSKRITCKDGSRQVCEMLKLQFMHDEKAYNEVFHIDPNFCKFFNKKDGKIAVGVLGADFLSKYGWMLDFTHQKE